MEISVQSVKPKANCEKTENVATNKSDFNKLVCEACELDKICNPAAAFCVDCQDYLCANCANHHCIPKPTKHHKVLSKDVMPKRKASTALSEDCAKHQGETIKFYCKNHHHLSCATCIATVHRTCITVCAITDFTKDIDKSPMYSDTKSELKVLENLFKSQKARIKEKDQTSRLCYTETMAEVQKRRQEFNKQFDKLEQTIKVESAKMSNEDIQKLKQLNDACIEKENALEEINSDLNLLEETKQPKQLFIAIKKAHLKFGEMKSALMEIKANTKISKYKLDSSELSRSLTVREDSLGFLEVFDTEHDTQTDTKCTHEQVSVPKLVEMPFAKVVSTDYQRCRVVLYNNDAVKMGSLKFPTGPWDLTRTSDNIVAVTFPHEKKIKFLNVEESINEVGKMVTPGHCRGIAAVNDKLAVTFTSPPGVKILKSTGETITDIPMSSPFVQLKEPAYVAADEDKNIFVTDPSMNIVVRMTINGTIVQVFRGISKPLHVCVQNRNIFVSETDKAIVHVLSPDFQRLETESSFHNEFTGDFSISTGGVAVNGIFKLKKELGQVTLINNANSSNKKCVVS